MKLPWIIVSGVALLAGGCCSHSKSKPELARGWIGGEFKKAGRHLVPDERQSRVFVKQAYPDTPAERAGLKTADLILAVNGESAPDLKAFRHAVETATPGSPLNIRVLRGGEPVEVPVTVGRETYKQWHSFSLGLGFSSRFDVLPNPDFSLMPLARYKVSRDRLELHSPEVILAKAARKENSEEGPGARSDEGWDAWFLIFGFNAHKRILSQEAVLAEH